MWDFKLKKTRIIFLISIFWCGFAYFFLLKGGLLYLINIETYYEMKYLGIYDSPSIYDWLFALIPVWIYWIVIPIIRITYRWIKGGV